MSAKEREKVREQKRKSSHRPADSDCGISLLMVDFSVIKETVYILAHTVVRKITYL